MPRLITCSECSAEPASFSGTTAQMSMVFSWTESGAKLPLVIISCPPGIEQAPGDESWLLLLLGVGVPNKVFEV